MCTHADRLAFSCTCRCFCPSGHAKRVAIWPPWLDTTRLAPVPHRQVVLTIPKRLRASCLYRRRLLGAIARAAARTVTAIRTLTGERDLAVGLVACLQTHGSRANGHPHRHLLVTDGGFRRFVRLERFDEAHAGARSPPRRGAVRGARPSHRRVRSVPAGFGPPPVTEVHAACTVPERERRHAAACDEALSRLAIARDAGRRVDPPPIENLVPQTGCNRNRCSPFLSRPCAQDRVQTLAAARMTPTDAHR